ncbi:acetyltransferase [Neobacillus ginsengisoli]|uniref:Acetyltransferase EpsM n=1 Tax=Neobacillus ginsengisoli TaxID=904295 RepID=A0ABT9XU07_9BACI|nr:acetyltransferase [Neobacillus ginsengisoli]MDQ0198780.1 acetyltransferase EpsM [Neobacillus ginsengisoli]
MKIAVIGRGGHSKVICDMILSDEKNEIVGFLDDKYEQVSLIENAFCGPIKSAKRMIEYIKDIKFVIAIGDNKVRELIAQRLKIPDEYYVTLIHNSAEISPSARIGKGTVVMPYTVINADTEIGLHSIINTGSVIEHDCKAGNYVHVCPSATLTGAVHLENGAFIGAGATIIPNIKIGEWSIIGAGATVINHIPSFCMAVGVPAKIFKVNEGGGEYIAQYNV